MTTSPFDSLLHAQLFGDSEICPIFGDEAAIAAMITVERALARAQGKAGLAPQEAVRVIDELLAGAIVSPEALAAGTGVAGVPVPALVKELRALLPPEAAHWLHWGATSQDIVDCGLMLRLAQAIEVLEIRLERLLTALLAAAERWRDVPMAGRTRSQIAAPITFGRRCATWADPIADLRAEIGTLKPKLLKVQLGGAVGTNAVLGRHGPVVAEALAKELGLAVAVPWHANRVTLGALGSWCAGVAGAAGKMAGDLALMGRSESGEASAGAGGGSSTMPQKSNPVAAETVVAIARYAAGLSTPMHLAAIHAEERDGTAWMIEWLALPQLVLSAGVALRHGVALAESLVPNRERMRTVLEGGGGLAMAEAASFLLAERRTRPEAETLIEQAVSAVRSGHETLAEALQRLAPEDCDWADALRPERLVDPDRTG